ncbi:MAG: hypothetical protein DMG31_06990 [Acidobacteria bacterium]|nr:MAG: hypothetical protein DMG31_06990 [Acidobacteriota bacterium]
MQLPELPDARMLMRRLMDSPRIPDFLYAFWRAGPKAQKNAAACIIAKARGARQCDSRESV